MPAVEAYLSQKIEEENERAARSRRAAKAVTYGSYNVQELIRVGAEVATDNPQGIRKMLTLLQTSVKISQSEGKIWADVTCILGDERLSADFNTSWPIVMRTGLFRP